MPIKCPKCHFENPDDTTYCGKCATTLKPSEEISEPTETLEIPKEELTTGSLFAGRYQIIEELGKGGMGKVYKAHDTKIKEKIALKLIKPEIAKDKKTIERFSNELRLARKIRQKNVCAMFDLGEEKGTQYITMEFVPGEDSRSSIRRFGQLPIGKSISIATQICEGLSEAHRLGVVHRDLKSNNIMIDKEGNVRIMDFGIARSLEVKGLTGEGVMIGTPEYMSPEQVEGKEVDQRSDIYSLGVILYEMVTGRVPFEGETPLGIAMKHKSEEPKDPRELNNQIPEDLSLVILRCLEKEKERRYQSAGEVRSELERVEKRIPATERIIPKRKPVTSREITVTFGLKKLLIPVSVLIAVVAIALILWHPWSLEKAIPIPSDKPSLAILYFDNMSGDESLDYWREGITELVITDLMQSKFINVLTRDRVLSILQKLNLLDSKTYRTEDLVQVANEGSVNHTVSGSYIKAGEKILITVLLQKPHTGEVIDTHRVTCRGEADIQPKVDELTRRIKSKLNLSQQQMSSDIDRAVRKITTNSSEALKAYLEGLKVSLRGDNRASLQFYEKAVSIDPDFAMAYRKMGSAYYNIGYRAKSDEFYKKAFELSDRMSDRDRYQIQGDYYRKDWRTNKEAVKAYTKLLELYPDDTRCNNNFGLLYLGNDEWDKAIERYETTIQNKDYTGYLAYSNVSNLYTVIGRNDKAIEVLESYLRKNPDHQIIRWRFADQYLDHGKYDLAHNEVDKALSFDPTRRRNLSLKGHIYLCQGDLARAKEQYTKILELDAKIDLLWGRYFLTYLNIAKGTFAEAERQATMGIALAEELEEKGQESGFYSNLASLHLNSDQPEKALKESEKALRSAYESGSFGRLRSSFIIKCSSLIMMGSLDEAERVVEELKRLIDEGINRKAISDYYYLLGKIEMEREQFPEAIEHFKQTIPLLRKNGYYLPMYFDALALAYYKSGDMVKAEEQYKRIISLPTGRILHGDIYTKSFCMLGKIYEEQGQKDNAIEHYEKFLDLWKDADPGIAEVEDAKKRLARLKSK